MPPGRRTDDVNCASKVYYAVGKIGDEAKWVETPDDLDKIGFVNQQGLSRKVIIVISSYMHCL